MNAKSDLKDYDVERLVAARTRELTEANETLRREISKLGRELERRALNFRLIVDSIPVPVAVTTPSGAVEHLNQATLDYFGETLEELKGWETSDAVHPEDRERTIVALHAAHEADRSYHIQSRFRRADGVHRWFNVLGLPLQDIDGHVLCWFHLLIDIDDRRRAEEALRESEACLAEGQALSSTGSFMWKPATDEHLWSEETFRIFECERTQEVTMQLIEDRVLPEDLHIVKQAQALTATGEDLDYECRFLMPSGTVKHLRIVAHSHGDAADYLQYVGAVQDVTQRRLSDEALSRLRSDLEHMARVSVLGTLTASIAHEVNQPLSGIITNANTCLRMLAVDPPNIAGAVETVRRTIRDGNRASEVLARLRTLFTKRETCAEPLDLNEAAREVIALSQSELQRRRVVIRSALTEGLPLIHGDRIQIQQVILNLVLNAADAMDTVDDRPRRLIMGTGLESDDHVLLSVQDVGAGISAENAGNLFEAFFTTKANGMGIGLSISRSIIEAHQGRLWATPNHGPGCTFSFVLPVDPDLVAPDPRLENMIILSDAPRLERDT